MFQMINEAPTTTEGRKALYYKIGMFAVAIAAVCGVLFLCVRGLS